MNGGLCFFRVWGMGDMEMGKEKEKENEGRGIFYTRYNTSCTFRLRNEIGLIQHASPRLRNCKNESNTHTHKQARETSVTREPKSLNTFTYNTLTVICS